MTQTASAFGAIQDGLSFFRNAYDLFAGYRAAIIRLDGLVIANEEGRALPQLDVAGSTDGTVAARRRRGAHSGRHAADRPARPAPGARRRAGDHRRVGHRQDHAAAQPRPAVAVRLRHADVPDDENETMFLSQMPYVPLGDLRAVVSLSRTRPATSPTTTLRAMLSEVALPHLVDRLDEVAGLGQGALPR